MTARKQERLPTVYPGIAFGVLLVYALAGGRPSTAAEIDSPCRHLRSQDQLWLVSHRGLGCRATRVEDLTYWRYDRQRRWVRSDLSELTSGDDKNLVTTVFVHGNQISTCEAFTKGFAAYRALARCADERPFRFIAWSWPSQRLRGPVNDVRTKAWRTNASAYYLAGLVDRLDPEEPVSLWGHSFGARIVTGALHLLGGGQLAGRRLLEREHFERRPMHAVLVAAALDNDWLLAGHTHGRAMSQIEGLLLVNNSCDAVLQRYHWIYHRRSCRQALGSTGLSCFRFEPDASTKTQQLDACCYVGREHALADYLCAPALVARMRRHLLLDPVSGFSAPHEKVVESEALATAD